MTREQALYLINIAADAINMATATTPLDLKIQYGSYGVNRATQAIAELATEHGLIDPTVAYTQSDKIPVNRS